jgi:predicted transcriptional regulator
VFQKEAKNKIRSFYKKFYELVRTFVDFVDKHGEEFERRLENDPEQVIKLLKKVAETMQQNEQRNNDVNMKETK